MTPGPPRPIGRRPGLDPARLVAHRAAISPAVRVAAPATEGSDYEVGFAIARPEGEALSADQWARAVFEGAPRAMRWFLIVGWTAITCRLEPRRSPSRVLGWTIERESPDVVVLAVRAWVGLAARIVVALDDDAVTVGSFVRYTGPAKLLARSVWTVTIPLHERILPALLTAAARRATQ